MSEIRTRASMAKNWRVVVSINLSEGSADVIRWLILVLLISLILKPMYCATFIVSTPCYISLIIM